MKRRNSNENDRDRQSKEPRLDVGESGSSEKSLPSTSLNNILRRKIEQKQAQKDQGFASKSQENASLNHWSSILSSTGYFCEVRPIVQSDLLESKQPNFVLIVEQSSNVQFSRKIGPFQSARLIIYPDGEWRLDSPILEHQKVAEGRLSCPVDTPPPPKKKIL